MQRRPYEDGELVAYTTRRHGRTVFTVRFRPFCPVEWRVLFQIEVDGCADVPDMEGIVLAAFAASDGAQPAGQSGEAVVDAGGLRIRAIPDDEMPDATPEKLRAVCAAVARALGAKSP
jgi:hypothetical protein